MGTYMQSLPQPTAGTRNLYGTFTRGLRKWQKVKTLLWAVTAPKTSVLTCAKKQASHRRHVPWRWVSSFSSPSLKHFSRPCFSACAPAQTLQHNKNKNKLSPILYLRRQRRWPQQGSNLNPFIVNSPSGRMTPKRHHKAFELKGPLLTGMNPEESSRRKQAGYAEPGLHKSAICCESRRAHPPPDCRSHFKMRAVTAAAVPRCQQLRWLQPYWAPQTAARYLLRVPVTGPQNSYSQMSDSNLISLVSSWGAWWWQFWEAYGNAISSFCVDRLVTFPLPAFLGARLIK